MAVRILKLRQRKPRFDVRAMLAKTAARQEQERLRRTDAPLADLDELMGAVSRQVEKSAGTIERVAHQRAEAKTLRATTNGKA